VNNESRECREYSCDWCDSLWPAPPSAMECPARGQKAIIQNVPFSPSLSGGYGERTDPGEEGNPGRLSISLRERQRREATAERSLVWSSTQRGDIEMQTPTPLPHPFFRA
jgi:hypothetical protein